MPPTFRPLQQQNKAEKQEQQHFFLQHFPPMLQSETGGKIGQSLPYDYVTRPGPTDPTLYT